MKRAKKQIYIAIDLQKRLQVLSAATGSSQSSIVQTALEEYLNRDEKDLVQVLKILRRIERVLGRLERDVALIEHTLTAWIVYWRAMMPEIADPRAAFARAWKWFNERFVNDVTKLYVTGRRLSGKLHQEPIDPANVEGATGGADKEQK